MGGDGGLFFHGGCTLWGTLVLMGVFRKDHMGEAVVFANIKC